MRESLGNGLLISSSRFPLSSGARWTTSDVPARARQTGDEPIANRIIIVRHDNGNRAGRFLGGTVTVGPLVTMRSTLRRTSSAATAEGDRVFPLQIDTQ